MKYFKCGYTWPARITSPKSCPRCKTRLDYKPQKGWSKMATTPPLGKDSTGLGNPYVKGSDNYKT